jgi:voltage-gated potassium channel Kch
MKALAVSPLRNLVMAVAFVLGVVGAATLAYMGAGWSFGDAIYMVLLTVYTVGYGEVHPIATPYLHTVTIATMVFGCTGMILVTSVLVQALTASQIQQLLGLSRVKSDIEKLEGHVIVCGFGRIGLMLAKDLAAGGVDLVILERGDKRFAEARDLGYLAIQGDATDESILIAAGVGRARTLATVLPDDAANVFITLSARGLNPSIQVIARGEAPSTQNKLIQAGADKVVLPTHIGAERIAELILFPETARFIRGSERMRDFEKVLGDLGLELEVVVIGEGSAAVGARVADLERRGQGAFFAVQVNRHGGETITRPTADTVLSVGDGLVVVGRSGVALSTIFTAPASRPKAGRTTY